MGKIAERIGVHCFCGHVMRISLRPRKPPTCPKCGQLLPVEAIRLAVQSRDSEPRPAAPAY